MKQALIIMYICFLSSLGWAQSGKAIYALHRDTNKLSITILKGDGYTPLRAELYGNTNAVAKVNGGTLQYSFSGQRDKRHFVTAYEGILELPDHYKVRDQKESKDSVFLYWLDATEMGLYPRHSYEIEVISTLYSDVDCSAGPVRYRPQKRGVAYGLIALGASSILAGELSGTRSLEAYDVYTALWENGSVADAANPFLADAREERDRQQLMQFVGGGLVIVGSSYLGYQWLRYLRRKKTYKTYCSGSSPAYLPSIAPAAAPGYTLPGVGLTWKFQ